jgi:hypothetical protein
MPTMPGETSNFYRCRTERRLTIAPDANLLIVTGPGDVNEMVRTKFRQIIKVIVSKFGITFLRYLP